MLTAALPRCPLLIFGGVGVGVGGQQVWRFSLSVQFYYVKKKKGLHVAEVCRNPFCFDMIVFRLQLSGKTTCQHGLWDLISLVVKKSDRFDNLELFLHPSCNSLFLFFFLNWHRFFFTILHLLPQWCLMALSL